MSKTFKNFLFFSSFLKFITFLIMVTFLFSLTGCSMPNFAKPSKVTKNMPVNAKERARKNVEEGRGISLKGAIGGRRSTTYQFSTSNPLWRATLELIDFIPLSTVDYSGGIIITDWYSDSQSSSDSIKITIRFLSNEIQSNSVKIIVHNKKCKTNEICNISEVDSKIKLELQKSILVNAAKLEKEFKKSKK